MCHASFLFFLLFFVFFIFSSSSPSLYFQLFNSPPSSLPPSKIDLFRHRVSLCAGPTPSLRLPRVSIKLELLLFVLLQRAPLDGLVAARHRTFDLHWK